MVSYAQMAAKTTAMEVEEEDLGKVVLQAGNGITASPGDVCSIRFSVSLLDCTIAPPIFSSFDPSLAQPLVSFTLGANQVIPGLDLAVATMTIGEVAKFTIPSRLAYGDVVGAPPHIPPKSPLFLQVQLVSVERATNLDNNNNQELAMQRREMGTQLLNSGENLLEAAALFEEAQFLLAPEQDLASKLLAAKAYLALGNNSKCILLCNQIVKSAKESAEDASVFVVDLAQTRLLRGKAYLFQGVLAEAKNDLLFVKERSPELASEADVHLASLQRALAKSVGYSSQSSSLAVPLDKHEQTKRVYFNLRVGENASAPPVRVEFELFFDTHPKTSENFYQLCQPQPQQDGSGRADLPGYKGTKFHRIIPGVLVQGGDVVDGDGTSIGTSIYGPKFADENLAACNRHAHALVLSMANLGRAHTNASQFFITLSDNNDALTHLDGRHVVFGRVVLGGSHLQSLAADSQVVVEDCGVVMVQD